MFGESKLTLRRSKQTTVNEVRDPFELPDGTLSYKSYVRSKNNR